MSLSAGLPAKTRDLDASNTTADLTTPWPKATPPRGSAASVCTLRKTKPTDVADADEIASAKVATMAFPLMPLVLLFPSPRRLLRLVRPNGSAAQPISAGGLSQQRGSAAHSAATGSPIGPTE